MVPCLLLCLPDPRHGESGSAHTGVVGEGWRVPSPACPLLSCTERQIPPRPSPLGFYILPEPILLVPSQCFHVPYSALTMFISREQSERDSATAYRKSFPPFPFPPFPFPFIPWGFGGSCSAAGLAHFSLGRAVNRSWGCSAVDKGCAQSRWPLPPQV